MNGKGYVKHKRGIIISQRSNKGRKLQINVNRPEIIGGAVALMFNGNPSDGEVIENPITKEKIPLIKGKETRFIVPAHIQQDYDYAIRNNLPIKQVIAPYFYGKGEEKVREEKETQHRHSVIAIVKHNIEDKYLCLDCKGRDCKSFVLGGVEEGETSEDAAKREIYEETGYKNVMIQKKSPIQIINHFYAGYKGINRYATLDIIYGKLENEQCDEISEEEAKKHIVKWIDKEDLREFININNNIYALNILMDKEKAWTDSGVMINSGKLNGMSSEKAGLILAQLLMKNKEEIEK